LKKLCQVTKFIYSCEYEKMKRVFYGCFHAPDDIIIILCEWGGESRTHVTVTQAISVRRAKVTGTHSHFAPDDGSRSNFQSSQGNEQYNKQFS
jgi:hypothetical protein